MIDLREQARKIRDRIQNTTKDNRLLFVIVGLGASILSLGIIPPYAEMLVALGAAFIIAGGVGIYMMLSTRQVAKELHNRLNDQNKILERLDKNSSKQTGILKDIASSQKEIASSQKQNHSEMIDVLKRIETGFSNLGEGLKRIENKL